VTILRPTRRAVALALAALAAVPAAAGCGRSAPPPGTSTALDVQVFRDTSATVTLHVVPPRVWLRGVAIARPRSIEAPLPAAEPGAAPPDTSPPPALPVDPRLKSPILKSAAPLVVPPSRGRGADAQAVELDVQVSDLGDVTDVRWAGASADTALVAAASACARSMRFHPALLGGKPVSVWCRQRFEFPPR
jgi:TonB family protein